MEVSRRNFVFKTAIGIISVSAGCVSTEQLGNDPSSQGANSRNTHSPSETAVNISSTSEDGTAEEATAPLKDETRRTSADLPGECARAVHFSELSSPSQEEFRMSLSKEGLTRNNQDDFQIRDELSNVDDEIGGGTESCVLFEGEYYYPIFGPIGGPDGEWELEYELIEKESRVTP